MTMMMTMTRMKTKTYYPSQDYGDDSNVDPEYRPSKKELKGADKEGDK